MRETACSTAVPVSSRPGARGRLAMRIGLRTTLATSLAAAVAAVLLVNPTAGAADGCGTNTGRGCAPASKRVDLAVPSFSNPTVIDNPLFPISDLHSVLLLGHVDGKPFRTETTLLPQTESVEWRGQQIEVRISQYMAYLNGQINEVALDRYAQADDGSVWYFGEDVFDYEHGTVALTEGTWLAGRDGPPAMIMPGHPNVGDVYRTENAPGIVFEEVTVDSVGKTVEGPLGPVPGAAVVKELHSDGTTERKLFASGYGEFRTSGGGDLEALALAVPKDALPGLPSPELTTLTTGAGAVLDAAARDRRAVAGDVATLEWIRDRFPAGIGPDARAEIDARLRDLRVATDAGNLPTAAHAARLGARMRHLVARQPVG